MLRLKITSLLTGILALVVLAGVDLAPAQAATFTAGTPAQLVAAIQAAEDEVTNPGADTIELTANIALVAAFDIGEQIGLPDITTTIIVDGRNFTLSRDPAALDPFRLFRVQTTGDLTLRNITLTGGLSIRGSAVRNNGGQVTIQAATLSGNQATLAAGSDGGAIWNEANGTVSITGSTLSGNTAQDDGGAISNDLGTISLNNVTLSGNSALGGGGDGGAIQSNFTTTLIITDSRITGNQAGRWGGGILTGGNTTLTNSTFDNNRAQTGGALYNIDATVNITNSTFDNNRATIQPGGAIYNTDGAINIAVSRFIDNSSVTNGGAIYNVDTASQINITTSTFTNNRSDNNNGGAIFSQDGLVTITGSTFDLNKANNQNGGALANNINSTMNVTNSTLSANSAANGGGIGNAGTMTLTNVTIADSANDSHANLNAGTATTLVNTILANPASGVNCDIAVGGFTDNGSNVSTDASCGFGGPPGGDNLTPGLGALANNGGSTRTHSIPQAPPAADTGQAGPCPAADQRGVPRPVGAGCDIGAYETGATLPLIFFNRATTAVTEDAGAITVPITLDNTAGSFSGPTITVYITVTGTATNSGIDYTLTTALPLTIPIPAAGTSTQQNLQFIITLDDLDEPPETVQLAMSLSGPATLDAARSTHTITISDVIPPVDPPPAPPATAFFDPAISKLGFAQDAGEIEWTISVTNNGAAAGIDAVITDTIADGLEIQRVTTTEGTASFTGQTVTVLIPRFEPGATVIVSIVVRVTEAGEYANTACIDAANYAGPRCTDAVPVSGLPVTGDSPWWHWPLVAAMIALLGGVALRLGVALLRPGAAMR